MDAQKTYPFLTAVTQFLETIVRHSHPYPPNLNFYTWLAKKPSKTTAKD